MAPFIQLADQNQAGVRGDTRSLKRNLQKPVKRKLERLGFLLTHAAMARALAVFDRAVADHARANLTGLLLDGVDADQIDDFREMEREMVAHARADYAAHVAAMLDAEW